MCWWRGGYLSESWGLNAAGIGSGGAVDSNRDRANLVLLGIIGSKLDVLTFIHTPGKKNVNRFSYSCSLINGKSQVAVISGSL